MQFLIRLSLTIILPTLALCVVAFWAIIGISTFRALSVSNYVKATSCAVFLDIMRSGNSTDREELTKAFMRADQPMMQLINRQLHAANATMTESSVYCLKNPNSSLYNAMIGQDSDEYDFAFMPDILNKVEALLKREHDAIDVTTPDPMPSEALMQKFNQEMDKARAEKDAQTTSSTSISPTPNTKN